MINGLAAGSTDVEHQLMSVELPLGRNALRGVDELGNDHAVVCLQVSNRRDVLLRDDENMQRCFRLDIAECNDIRIFKHRRCRKLMLGDFAKDAFGHIGSLLRGRTELPLQRLDKLSLGDGLLDARGHLAEDNHIIERLLLTHDQRILRADAIRHLELSSN